LPTKLRTYTFAAVQKACGRRGWSAAPPGGRVGFVEQTIREGEG
jgi:hypothetical protein